MNRSLIYLTVLAGLVAVFLPAAQWALGVGNQWWLAHHVSDMEYAGWLDDAEIGCQSLEARRPNLLLVGNSGSHSALNARRIQARLPGYRVGDCRLGGTAIHHMPLLFERLERNGVVPAVILLGVNQEFLFGRFMSEADDRQYRQYKEAMTEDRRFQLARRLFWAALGKRYALGEPPAATVLAGIDAALLDQSVIDDADQRREPWPQIWRAAEIMAITARSPEVDTGVDAICAFVRKHRIRLVAVQTPLSPVTAHIYNFHVQGQTELVLDKLRRCAAVVPGEQTFSGLNGAYFLHLDRQMPKDLDGLKARLDGNHINPIGAALFTDRVLAVIDHAGDLQR